MLPTTATAPFCPAEVNGSIRIDAGASFGSRLRRFAGPGLLVAVGYMDPGNWATDIEAGSRFGYQLLWVVMLSGLAAMLLQMLAARLGLVTGLDLAQASARRYGRAGRLLHWLSAEVSIVACDVAEVLGCALAFKLLFGVPLAWGVGLTAFDTLIVLGLKGRGFRQLEAIVLGLVATIALCFLAQLALLDTRWSAVAAGLAPTLPTPGMDKAVLLALGIVGATIMPHNLYLHSSVVQTRRVDGDDGVGQALFLCRIDTIASLLLAMLVNGAILVLAGSAFHAAGHTAVADIAEAHQLIRPLAGSMAALLFGIALLAAGQSATLTGTVAGQVIMDGFLGIRIPCYQRRLITRALALLPALAGIVWQGESAVGPMLVWSQVVLGLQLPLAMWPLLRLSGDAALMGEHAPPRWMLAGGWGLFGLVLAANLALLLG
ncbi:divalent metal cation transporter [Chromobacterium sp. ATCC 53434]|uniref:Nramp family divalent metal transporter n=1 Tax=Chromobacterium sp. (strain ATCC 53434 / SC 14030) TaxID=2059672 RepID=UPI000C76A14A|nr:Nramp family divalent metal transporter [Chromobacterium sp. ATCC 53434]AUH53368.1 divalent metal cation transporter [Chromobacterium sp. ATCC 53434]